MVSTALRVETRVLTAAHKALGDRLPCPEALSNFTSSSYPSPPILSPFLLSCSHTGLLPMAEHANYGAASGTLHLLSPLDWRILSPQLSP